MNRHKNSKHLYDIDPPGMLRTLLDGRGIRHLAFNYPEARTEFCDLIRSAISDLEGLEEQADHLLARGTPLLLQPHKDNRSYCYWLGIQLSIATPGTIPLIQDHHWRKTNRQAWFRDHVEFQVLRSLPSNRYFDTTDQQERITHWLRQANGSRSAVATETELPTDKSNKPPRFAVDAAYVDRVVEGLKEFLAAPKQEEELRQLLLGEKQAKAIQLNCARSLWFQVFKHLIKAGMIKAPVSRLGTWMHAHFTFLDPRTGTFMKAGESYLKKLTTDARKVSPTTRKAAGTVLKNMNL